MTRLYWEALGDGEPLVMLHGWGMQGAIWQAFAQALAKDYQVFSLDLPGHGFSAPVIHQDLAAWAATILTTLPVSRFKLLGWSLGAMIALQMTNLAPQRVQSLCLLAGNPCFVEQTDWPGMRLPVLDAFAEQLRLDAQQTLLRFLSLQVQGLLDAKFRLQQIRQAILARPAPDMQSLEHGLAILKNADLRQAYVDVSCPLQVILGAKDTLVPVKLAGALQSLRADARIDVIDGAGHVPFISHADQVLNMMRGAACSV